MLIEKKSKKGQKKSTVEDIGSNGKGCRDVKIKFARESKLR